ncbi:hypothetical protein ColLi_05308 [Colletotrichum liriopes]|uniref:Uncharacterized protein n=1 Tax=Colletotrichum liriopes TaxID=708192 RepID=A0AA37GKU8_9PEZI|nr:hypothetical protein ColLi_05308 [Colletotrichum liriopes]
MVAHHSSAAVAYRVPTSSTQPRARPLCVPFVPGQPKAPKPSPDGTCVTHSIEDSEECVSRAKELGVTVDDLKK